MEASLLAVTPTPMAPKEAAPQTPATSDETTPFTTFLSAARTTGKSDLKEKKFQGDDVSTSLPGQQEVVMQSELAALAANQLIPETGIAASLTKSSDGSVVIRLTANELKDLQAMLVANGLPALSDSGLNPSQLGSGNGFSTALTNITDTAATIHLTPDELKSLQAMLAANGLPALKPAEIATEKQTLNTFSKTDPLVTQQLQTILGSDSRNTLVIQTSPQPVPAQALNTLSSPYLHTADSTSGNPVLSAQSTMAEATTAPAPKKAADAPDGLRHNMEEQYWNGKLEALPNKNNARGQQHDPGQNENSPNQQNIPLANNGQTSQFIVTSLGTTSSATSLSPGSTSVAHSATFAPGMPIPAEEIISHLVERFSSNPRLQTSKISLNLNPAELGELKINIMVKGDSIKAHIVAGSQQIQDTIEKHMPKLRTILEQQGFNVEDFQVTLESTDSDSNHFFQKQFSSRQESTPQKTHVNSETAFDLSLNVAEENLHSSPDSGINLNI